MYSIFFSRSIFQLLNIVSKLPRPFFSSFISRQLFIYTLQKVSRLFSRPAFKTYHPLLVLTQKTPNQLMWYSTSQMATQIVCWSLFPRSAWQRTPVLWSTSFLSRLAMWMWLHGLSLQQTLGKILPWINTVCLGTEVPTFSKQHLPFDILLLNQWLCKNKW